MSGATDVISEAVVVDSGGRGGGADWGFDLAAGARGVYLAGDLRIASSPGADDIYFQSLGEQTSVVVSNLPTDGRMLLVSIESRIADEWFLRTVTYFAAGERGTPAISEGGIVSANLTPRIGTISSGSIFSIFGENFSSETILYPNLDNAGRLARILGGVCLEMNGERLPIFAVTPNQINAQVSDAQSVGPAGFIVITNCDGPLSQALSSVVSTVDVETAPPGFFLFPPLATSGFIAAQFNETENQPPVPVAPASLFPNDSYGSSRPARPRDIILLYGTGWGETTARLGAGEQATSAAELLPDANPTISFGSVLLASEDIFYVGVTPGAAGLYQAAIRIPVGAQEGNNQVILTVYGKSTPTGPVIPVALP